MTYDVLVREASPVDGTGAPAVLADVGISGGRIVAVGTVPEDVPAARIVDASGLVLAPGFIDVHSHSDVSLLLDGVARARSTRASRPT